jgi:hypothetical protein
VHLSLAARNGLRAFRRLTLSNTWQLCSTAFHIVPSDQILTATDWDETRLA